VGAQTLVEDCRTAGAPSISTRLAATMKVALTQGPLPDGGTKPQPATLHGEACATAGCPDRNTRAEGAVGSACPPCVQVTAAPRCRIGPDILLLSALK